MDYRSNNFLMTSIAMLAFAGNSILCRMALSEEATSAESFTLIRLLSGALMLSLLIGGRNAVKKELLSHGSWISGLYLFVYAAAFSFAYIYLDTATGALILFATVQLSVLAVSIFSGEKMTVGNTVGVVLAFSGFLLLMMPGTSQPSTQGAILMFASGVAWAAYTLAGRGVDNPLLVTQGNFVKASAIAVLALVWFVDFSQISGQEILLAVASGALASGCGYAIWYLAIKGLTRLSSGIVQLTVPVIAALGGIVFVGETLTLNFSIASLMVLAGVGFVVYESAKPQ